MQSGKSLVPEDLVRTRVKNSEWKGLYGRVDARGCFSTVTTEPGPKRKQGQVLHYNQDRMLSVREFARAQVSVWGHAGLGRTWMHWAEGV
jgi:DNA (cytosine-5)-methyltransferase 1